MFVVTDAFIGIYLYFFETVPNVQEGLKEKLQVTEHPYKSYINKQGVKYHNNLTVVNDFGHQVLPEDIDIAKRPKEPYEYRILFLGGSTTFQPWSFYLSEILNAKHKDKKFKVINAGTGGYTSQENLIDLVVSGFSYQPDMVIAYLPINDIYWSALYPDFQRDYTHMRIPLKYKEVTSMPEYNSHFYPFSLRLLDLYRYIQEYKEYLKKTDLMYYTTKQPVPYPNPPFYEGAGASFNQTVDALIDNIYNMKTLSEARGVKFVLITQKIFRSPYGYYPENKYVTIMDNFTFKAIKEIKSSEKLAGTDILEMQNKFPDQWDENSVKKVKEYFPEQNLNFSEKMAYDDMHFRDAALHLFAGIVYEHIVLQYNSI